MNAFVLAAMLGATAPGSDSAVLQPSGAWNVDYGESACVAGRAYGSGKGKIILAFHPAPVDGTTQLLILREGRVADARQYDATINGGAPMRVSLLQYSAAKANKTISRITLTCDQFQSLRSVGVLRIRGGNGASYRFAIKQLAAVKEELGKCVADLDRYWQMGPDQLAKIKTPAQAVQPLTSYFSSGDYPAQALSEHSTGRVGVRLMIDEKGAVKECATTETSGSGVLDAMTCIVLQDRAKFHPALDIDGKPVKSFDDTRVKWLIR